MPAHAEGGRSVVMFKHAMTKISSWCTTIVFYNFLRFLGMKVIQKFWLHYYMS